MNIQEAAEKDFRNTFLWYENQKQSLGISFQKRVLETIESIALNPLKYQVRYKNIRFAFTKQFPFGIHFYVEESTIEIISGSHTSQKPHNW